MNLLIYTQSQGNTRSLGRAEDTALSHWNYFKHISRYTQFSRDYDPLMRPWFWSLVSMFSGGFFFFFNYSAIHSVKIIYIIIIKAHKHVKKEE